MAYNCIMLQHSILSYCSDKTLWPKVTYTRKLPFGLMIQEDTILPWQGESWLVYMTAGTKCCEIILSAVKTEQKANRKQGDDMNTQEHLQWHTSFSKTAVPNLPQTGPLTKDQVFKYLYLGEIFLFKSAKAAMAIFVLYICPFYTSQF